jgi:hypothetical protein
MGKIKDKNGELFVKTQEFDSNIDFKIEPSAIFNSILTGTSITYSGGKGSAIFDVTGTFARTNNAFSSYYSSITNTGSHTSSNAGIIGIKQVVTNTAAMTYGNIYGGQFIAKHNHATNQMSANAALIGIEGWAYISGAAHAGTIIGGNFGFHNEGTGTAITGSVHRGIQIFCDNASGANGATESTGLCIWNMAGTITNAINIVNSGSGFTNFALFTDDGAPAASTCSSVSAIGTKGYIKVKVGTATRYIGLS